MGEAHTAFLGVGVEGVGADVANGEATFERSDSVGPLSPKVGVYTSQIFGRTVRGGGGEVEFFRVGYD